MVESKKNKKVYVGLSGGVDSSVAAALLKEDGYDVTGVFIKTWHPDFLPCTWKEERRDAMRVAAALSLPFKTLDLEKEYKEKVADYMIDEYKKGRTPNPDVMCNREVKFSAFWDFAKKEGAHFIATGHYARRGEFGEGKKTYKLLQGLDKNKDQSYFLWTLTDKDLEHILFPIGEYQKDEVRKKAAKFNLPTATKKDSQGVCFLGELDMAEFLKRFIPSVSGKVLNVKGEVIGIHEGALFYTLGQRHGFTIEKKGTNDDPMVIVAKDVEKNTITVAEKERERKIITSVKKVILSHSNFSPLVPESSKKYQCRFRYRQECFDCVVQREALQKEVCVVFDTLQAAVSPGQSLVVYDKDVCLGGGIIERAE